MFSPDSNNHKIDKPTAPSTDTAVAPTADEPKTRTIFPTERIALDDTTEATIVALVKYYSEMNEGVYRKVRKSPSQRGG